MTAQTELRPTCKKASVQLNCWTVTLPELHAVELVSEKMLVKTEILFDTLRTFVGCCARQERLHQFIVTLKNVVLSSKLVSAALLIILWSTVQVRDALPFKSTTYEPLMFHIRGFCLFRLHAIRAKSESRAVRA